MRSRPVSEGPEPLLPVPQDLTLSLFLNPSGALLVMSLSITGIRSELGQVLAGTARPGAAATVHFNLAGQQANTLLHDGHAWKDFARRLRTCLLYTSDAADE